MAIVFHCEHCGGEIQAPAEAGGKKGKCPKCQNVVYVPLPADASGEIPLAPPDTELERKEAAARKELYALQNRLLRERNLPGEQGGRGAAPGARRPPLSDPVPSPAAPPADLARTVKDFIRAMSEGRLDQADACVVALSAAKAKALAMIDNLSGDELFAREFAAIPRPVLMGFLKELRQRL